MGQLRVLERNKNTVLLRLESSCNSIFFQTLHFPLKPEGKHAITWATDWSDISVSILNSKEQFHIIPLRSEKKCYQRVDKTLGKGCLIGGVYSHGKTCMSDFCQRRSFPTVELTAYQKKIVVEICTSWWLNHPFEKYVRQNWIISPMFGGELKNVWSFTT